MGHNHIDNTYQANCPTAPPSIVTVSVTTSWTPATITLTPGVQRYRIQTAVATIDYEVRYGSEATGFKVPSGSTYQSPWLSSNAVPSFRVASGTLSLQMFLEQPDV